MRLLTMALLLCAAFYAQADTITATFTGVSPSLQVKTSINSGTSWSTTSAGTFNFSGPNGDFVGFCIDLPDPVSVGQQSVWTVGELSQGPNLAMGAARATDVSRLLGGVLGANLSAASSLSSTQAAALQLSVWEIVNEVGAYNLLNGSAQFKAAESVTTLANSWLTNLDTFTAMPGLVSIRHPRVQDFVVQTPSPVPLPAAFWLFGSALVGLTGLKLSRNKRVSV